MAKATCSIPGCEALSHARGWCSTHYDRWYRHGSTDDPDAPAVRFWRKVQKTETCWLWTGHCTAGGYGTFSLERRSVFAHRFAYELVVGPIPEGLTLDHRCHNEDRSCPAGDGCLHRRCVRPDHLEPATMGQNVRRGNPGGWTAGRRAARTHCKRGHLLSEANVTLGADGGRRCRLCRELAWKRQADRRRERFSWL